MDTNGGVFHSTLNFSFKSPSVIFFFRKKKSLHHLPNAAVCGFTPFIACAQSSATTITPVAEAEAEEENLVENKHGRTEDHSTRNRRDPKRRSSIWTPWRQERHRRIASSGIRLPICIHSLFLFSIVSALFFSFFPPSYVSLTSKN